MTTEVCIVGYGNPQRRDDGIGPSVVEGLTAALGGEEGVRILSLHQLDPDLIEELGDVEHLILVDASVEGSEGGVDWEEVVPDLGAMHPLSHHMTPAFFLALWGALRGRSPRAWLVSVQGEDFGLGEGLSPRAQGRAHRASREIIGRVRDRLAGRNRSPEEAGGPGRGEVESSSPAPGG
jgi:hydrogenase maturation protease